ncbi:large conductance mechanosensitive channel protein MscL [Candidatus Microgenomates bacterium]|nr:MAG: large conductance mechanosensitive channel protein MscL [Candidatus Microgenomates bacterium]
MLKEFKKFVLRGSLIDLAIGFTVGAAFSTVAKSLVNDIIMPPVSFFLGGTSLENSYLLLKSGDPVPPYQTLADAQSAGAVTLNFGAFLNNVLALFLVALAMFIIIKAVNKFEEELGTGKSKSKEKPANKKCKYCFSTIDYRATRCPSCTSNLPSN